MSRIRSILFVCKANICRSPTAEAVLRALLAERGGSAGVVVESAGTHEFRPGAQPHALAIEAARMRGYDLTGCTARQVRPSDFDRFDMILAMDKANIADLRRIAPTRCKQKIELLLDYGDRFCGEDVTDPIGGDAKQFARMLEMVEDGCSGLAQLLVRAA